MQISELRSVDGYYKSSVFEGVIDLEDAEFNYYFGIDFEVQHNTPQLLSVRFSLNSCGATCYYWTTCYNFNAQTGEPIQLGDLLTAEGLENISNKAATRWKARVDDALKTQDELDADAAATIGECLEDTDMMLESFYVQGNDLIIDAENCLPMFAKFMDIDTAIRISVKELTPFLSDYGKSIFGIGSKPVSGFASEYLLKALQVYGNKSKDVFLGLVTTTNGTVGYYANKKAGIYAYGESENNTGLVLGVDNDGGRIGSITIDLEGNNATVVYEDANGKKMPVLLVKD